MHEITSKMELDLLTTQQRYFVAAYRGDPQEAARVVLPDGTKQQQYLLSRRMMNNDLVRKNIQVIRDYLIGSDIADSFEVLLFWSDTMRNPEIERKDRTKCSELLAKFHGMLNDVTIHDNRSVILSAVEQLGMLLPHEQREVEKVIEHHRVAEDITDLM